MNPDRIDNSTRDLRIALKTLSDQSLKTSRRLDDTYYSILEKLSVLRQTIGSLQELSGLTKELHDNFESDTKELLDDVQGQYDGFDNFDGQQQQIVGLEERMQVGKKKVDSLTERLAKAKERVDARAQSESEWTAKNTRTTFRCRIYQILTSYYRSHSHLLGYLGLHSCCHFRRDYISPLEAHHCCAGFSIQS
jgi:chromosome segregation ATPase